MLRIDRATYDAIVAHAKRDHPDEACGIVAGPEGSDRPSGSSRWSTPPGRPTFYEFDSTELLALYKEMGPTTRSRSSSTTPTPPPRPTRAAPTSASPASRGAHYVLVSTREHGNNEGPVEFRSYRIVDGEVTEEEVGRRRPAVPASPLSHD